MGVKLKLENVTLAFFDGFKAVQYKGSGPFKYRVTSLISKDRTDLLDKIKAAMKKVAVETWDDKAEAILAKAAKDSKTRLLTDGDETEYAGFAGHWGLAATRNQDAGRPDIRDRDGKTPLAQEDGRPYSGSIGDVIVELWAQNNEHGKCIRATLLGIQHRKDGVKFSGVTTAADDDFADLVDGKDDDMVG